MNRSVLICLPLLLLNVPAHAQVATDAAAEAAFDAGRAALTEGRFDEAARLFEESNRLAPSVGALLNVGRAREKAGKTASAWAAYRQASALAARNGDGARAEASANEAARLEGSLVRVRVSIDQPDGVVIKVDGTEMPFTTLSVGIPMDPGEHALAAEATGKRSYNTRFSVPLSATAPVILYVPALQGEPPPPLPVVTQAAPPSPAPAEPAAAAPPPQAADPPPPSPAEVPAAPPEPPPDDGGGMSAQGVMGLTLAGAGLVAVGVSVFMALGAKSDYDDAQSHCNTNGACDDTGFAQREDATARGMTATIVGGAGGGALIVGGLLFLAAPSSPSSSSAGAGSSQPRFVGLSTRGMGVSLSGRF